MATLRLFVACLGMAVGVGQAQGSRCCGPRAGFDCALVAGACRHNTHEQAEVMNAAPRHGPRVHAA